MRLIIGNVAQPSRIRVQATLGYSDSDRCHDNLQLNAEFARGRFDPSEQSTILSLISIYESHSPLDPEQLHLQTRPD